MPQLAGAQSYGARLPAAARRSREARTPASEVGSRLVGAARFELATFRPPVSADPACAMGTICALRRGSIGVRMRPAVKALVRRLLPRVAQPLSLALPRTRAPEGPILVVGCARAGTSALLQLLLRSPELRSIHNEGHILWDPHHHPKDRGWDSDALGAADVSERERAYIYLAVRMFVRDRRFVDKTAENCLRI